MHHSREWPPTLQLEKSPCSNENPAQPKTDKYLQNNTWNRRMVIKISYHL